MRAPLPVIIEVADRRRTPAMRRAITLWTRFCPSVFTPNGELRALLEVFDEEIVVRAIEASGEAGDLNVARVRERAAELARLSRSTAHALGRKVVRMKGDR